eukprot:463627-Prymnesium_polylepis.2
MSEAVTAGANAAPCEEPVPRVARAHPRPASVKAETRVAPIDQHAIGWSVEPREHASPRLNVEEAHRPEEAREEALVKHLAAPDGNRLRGGARCGPRACNTRRVAVPVQDFLFVRADLPYAKLYEVHGLRARAGCADDTAAAEEDAPRAHGTSLWPGRSDVAPNRAEDLARLARWHYVTR